MTWYHHQPVMLKEVIFWLNAHPGTVVVDATLGGGGYARALLLETAPDGVLVGIDRDADAVNEARRCLAEYAGRTRISQSRMSDLERVLDENGFLKIDGVVADLGVSSHQLAATQRGFSFSSDGPLDMRMDAQTGMSATELIERLDEKELADLIFEYGEDRLSRRIARSIKNSGRISTARELAEAVVAAYPARMRRGRIHPATRTFQALRIAVNDELTELGKFLDAGLKRLAPGARMVVVSYHSLEDRLVKTRFRRAESEGGFSLPARKVVKPSESEVRENPRARSAKLRVIERTA